MSEIGEIYLGDTRIGVSITEYNQAIASVQALLDSANASIVLKDAEILEKTYPYPASLFQHNSDHRDFPGDTPDQATVDWLINTMDGALLYYQYDYYVKIASFLDDWWDVNALYRLVRYADTTNVTSLPDVPVGKTPRARYLYFDYSYSTGPSWNDAGINDIPTSWRQIWDLDRLYFQRNELTSDKQLGIVQGIERELIAGMGRTTATIGSAQQTGVFYIYFTSTSTGRNDSITGTDHAALISDGWVQSGSTRLIKTVAGRQIYLYYIP